MIRTPRQLFFSSIDPVALRTFKSCVASRFTRLRRLQFAFLLPMETILDEVDLNWFHLGHDAVHQHVDKVLLLYTSPYQLHHQRHLYNRVCEQSPTSNETMEHLQWTVDCDPSSMDDTLTHLQRVHSLMLYADIQVRPTRLNHSDADRARSSRRYLLRHWRGPLFSRVCARSNSTSTIIQSMDHIFSGGP